MQSKLPLATTYNAKSEWSLTEGGRLRVFYEDECEHSDFMERIYRMQLLGSNVGKSIWFLKFIL